MGAILINTTSSENLKLLKMLAARLGEKATTLTEEEAEDFLLGVLMKKSRTGKNVSKESVLKKLAS